MSERVSLGNVDFEFGTCTSPAPRKAKDDTPFCIAILADFSGRGNRGLCESGSSLAARGRVLVDVDNVEELPMKLGSELHVAFGSKDGPRTAVRFGRLSDLHPDQIFERLEGDPPRYRFRVELIRRWIERNQPLSLVVGY